VAEIQGLPFAFTRYAQIDRVNQGALGDLIGRECAAKGIHRFGHGTLENGFRQIVMVDRPIRAPADLAGVRMRVPDGEMFRDAFAALGAAPVTVNIAGLYASLRDHKVDGQENPLVVTEVNRLYEVSRYVSMTNHMWSGFNLLANAAFWARLPSEVQRIVDRNVARAVLAQRRYTRAFDQGLARTLPGRGMVFNRPDMRPFREALGVEFYRRWKERLGARAWALLEREVGKLPA
jgi:TRAP-type C4-dicarboxylate transport system substrate-binding protein